jgi:ribosomal protein L35
LLKRIRITKSGKIKCRVANGSHLRSGKPAGRLRHMRKARFISNNGLLKRIGHLLGRRVEPANGKVKTSKRQNVKTMDATP